jgi:endonuclease/exonuclease/phosphatase family metal-dependent hydrolase
MSEFSVVTLNMLDDLSRWDARREVMLTQMNALRPDIVALQEVADHKGESTAQWLADQLNQQDEPPDPGYQVFPMLVEEKYQQENLAILSRWPIKRNENVPLEDENHVAQFASVRVDDFTIFLVNVLFYHEDEKGSDIEPDQVEQLLDFLDGQSYKPPVLICGDFGCTPDSAPIQTMLKYFDSAHRQVHDREPDYTYPTPLPQSWQNQLVGWLESAFSNHQKNDEVLRITLDYIFADPRFTIHGCQLAFNQPSEDNEDIYASDHFGLYAQLKAVR